MGIFRTITTPQGHDQPNDLSSPLEARVGKRACNKIRDEWVRGHGEMRSRHQHRQARAAPREKKFIKAREIAFVENGKARKWRPNVTVKRGRDAPHAALPRSQLLLLVGRILQEAVRRISHDRVNRTMRLRAKPSQAVRREQFRFPVAKDRVALNDFGFGFFTLVAQAAQAVSPATGALELFARIQPEVGPHRRFGQLPLDSLGYALANLRNRSLLRATSEKVQDGIAHLAGLATTELDSIHASSIDV